MSPRAFKSLVQGRMQAKREDYLTARDGIIAAGTPAPPAPKGHCCENERRSFWGGCLSCGDPCL